MTQIVSISASTAAYAAEHLRPNARVSGVSPVESATRALTVEGKSQAVGQAGAASEVRSSGLTMFFLGAGERRSQKFMTRAQAEEEYRINGSPTKRKSARPEQDNGANSALSEGDPEPMPRKEGFG